VNSLAQTVRVTADGEDVRRRVLDAAEQVFAERGYAGGTTRDIALRADITKRMLFYYFPSKAVLYREVLERVIENMVAVQERRNPRIGPTDLLATADGLTEFAVAHLDGLRLLLREIFDGGAQLPALAAERLGPLFARGAAGIDRDGNGSADPLHVMVNVGGMTLFYFLLVPLLKLVWDRDPLAPETLAERAAVVREWLVHGVAHPVARGGTES
jgi:TetR/AcrR family transcriptional regulator